MDALLYRCSDTGTCSFADDSGSTQYCYVRFGHLVRKVKTTTSQTHTVCYTYAKAGQPEAIEYSSGTFADYVRDPLGHTTEIGITAHAKFS